MSPTPWSPCVDHFGETRRNRGTRSASEFTLDTGAVQVIGSDAYPVISFGSLIMWTPYYEGERGSDLRSTAAFVSDRWELTSRLALSLGLRYDKNLAHDALGQLISDDAGFNPRIGGEWDVRGDGRHRLIAGYGRYAAKLLEWRRVAASGRDFQLVHLALPRSRDQFSGGFPRRALTGTRGTAAGLRVV